MKPKEDRERRLAEALRANLRRRKLHAPAGAAERGPVAPTQGEE